jgi:hypothetical protein
MEQLKLSVEYYNQTQKQLFQSYPNSTLIDNLIQRDVKIVKDEFLAYMMFTEQMERDGFRTYSELQARIQNRLVDIDDFLSFKNESIQSKMTALEMMQPGFTERIGVALGLCFLNTLHSLTAADWKKIPETRGRNANPTFDFEIPIASTGTSFIQAENKGSVVENNSEKPATVQNHYSAIKTKKDYVREQEKKASIPIHQNLYYGTIGVVDNRSSSVAKLLLVDPPAYEVEMDAKKYKLLARLNYYLDEFKNIGVKKKIIQSLEQRIKDIEASEEFMAFNNKKLDEKFPSGSGYYLYMEGKVFALVDTNEAFGRIFLVEFQTRTVPYLIAFPKSLMRLIIRQDFDGILNYSYNPDFMNGNIQVLMRFDKAEMVEQHLSEKLNFVFNEEKSFYEAVYFGKVNHNTDGRIFGILDEAAQKQVEK